ncbi:MAG: transporter substrate-binding domain-containing protein [Alphaproteobacteria bacterium]|nr:transporter substrate-binding domain-containing protein [Alphaproteobacteria bacterium]
MIRLPTSVLAGALALALVLPAAAQQGGPPLRTAVDGTFAPHAMPKMGGGVEGFQIDLFTEVARRMKREIQIDSASFSGLIPAMNAGRYDFLAAPVTATKERAESLLFTEGYLYTEYQFLIRKGSPPLTRLEDLKGKVVSVNKGSAYDGWARANAGKYGFEVQSFDTNPDAIQAVLAGRAYAILAGNTGNAWAAKRNPQLELSMPLTETRAHWSAPFRKDSAELRNQIEEVLECMKLDGTIVKLSEKWFGAAPAPDAAERTVFPGFGVPGLPGYDPTAHTPRCG